MREVAAEFRNPVMLYSIGKDSSVMLHLAMKAFYPSKPPFRRCTDVAGNGDGARMGPHLVDPLEEERAGADAADGLRPR